MVAGKLPCLQIIEKAQGSDPQVIDNKEKKKHKTECFFAKPIPEDQESDDGNPKDDFCENQEHPFMG
ncbi:hypothetical protein [Brevibacillus sp. NL20B1]|uniref:hypothetical protein n=1 Tax=Brevibacillus sp. NL20B1 TaxID=2829799 RepID=UPI002012AD2F|nr:hypothetical protein [Brevibacillus sp. NL20B1]